MFHAKNVTRGEVGFENWQFLRDMLIGRSPKQQLFVSKNKSTNLFVSTNNDERQLGHRECKSKYNQTD